MMQNSIIKKISGNKRAMKNNFIDLFSLSFGLMTSRVLMFVSSIIIARVGGAMTYGEFSLFITIFLVISEAPNAINSAFIRFDNSEDKKYDTDRHLLVLLESKILYAIVAMLIGLLGMSLYVELYANDAKVAYLIRMGIITGSIYSIFTTAFAVYQNKRRFAMVGLLRAILNASIFFLVIYYGLYKGFVLTNDIVSGYLVVSILLSIATLFLLRRAMVKVRETYQLLRRFIKTAGMFLSITVFTMLSNRLDTFFIISLISVEALGYYSVALRLSSIVTMIGEAVATILFPKAAAATSDYQKFKRYVCQSFFFITAIMFLAAGFYLFHEHIIMYTFGPDFMKVSYVFLILLMQMVIISIVSPFRVFVMNGRNSRYLLGLAFLRMVLSSSLFINLVPKYELAGVAYALLLTEVIISIGIIILTITVAPKKNATAMVD